VKVENKMHSQPGKIEVPRARLSEALLLPSRYLTGINVLLIQDYK
jgi:hypothetical protein